MQDQDIIYTEGSEEYEKYLRRKRRRAEQIKKKKRRKRIIKAVTFVICICVVFVMFTLIRNNIISRDNYSEEVDFEKVEWYKQDNAGRYTAYSEKRPQLSQEDVVWQVNSMLDYEMYNHDVPVSGYDDLYIIVNKYYKVSDDYCPPDLVSLDGVQVRESTKTAFEEMRRAAKADGRSIRVVSGYRTVEYQQGLYNRYLASDSKENVDRYSARPGYSEHHTGYAIDLFGSQDGLRNFVNTPEYTWVKENCYKYGFIIRYTEENEAVTGYESEPWHLRYIGVEAATDMHCKNVGSFEEYKAKYLD